MCGLEITVRGEEVTRIRPHKEDVFSKGHICPKGTTLGKLHSDPTRLRGPVVRDGDGFRQVSWEEAFETCERLIHGVVAEHGKEALTAFVGNPAAHAFSIGRYLGIMIGMGGIPHIYSSGTVDQWPKNVTAALMYGNMWTIPVPDLQRSDFMVLMGANPQASQGSLMACADVLGELDRIRAEGGKVIVIDPRRTGTVRHASEWIPIVPGTDAALLLAVVNVLYADGLVDLGGLADIILGEEKLAGARGPVHARAGRRRLPDPRRAHPRAGPRDRRRQARRGLRPDRPVQPGVRHARELAHRRRQHPHRRASTCPAA